MWAVARNKDDTLPASVDVTERDVTEYYDLWLLWRSTERKHLPFAGGLLDQPERMMMTLITLDGLYGKIEAQQMEIERKANG